MTIPPKLQQHIDDFKLLQTKQEQYEHLIDLAQTLPELPQQYKTPENKVPGCVSNVHIHITKKDNKVHIQASSDALLIRGFIAILVDALDNQPLLTVKNIPDDIVTKFGLNNTITPSRMNATYNVIKFIKKRL